MTDEIKKYNNASQEAERLGVNRGWIWKKARTGEIPCSRIGKYYFFIPKETDEWIKKHAA